jgi:hypothetical protein
MLYNMPYYLMQTSGLHPTILSHLLISEILFASFPPLFNIVNQKLIVNGDSELTEVKLRNFKAVVGGNVYPLAVDADGNIGFTNSMRDGLMLNQTYLMKGFIQANAVANTDYNEAKDFLLDGDSRFITAVSPDVYNMIQVGSQYLDMTFKSTYANGTMNFIVSGGTSGGSATAMQIDKNANVIIYNALNCSQIKVDVGAYAGKFTVLDASVGHSYFENSYINGVFKWYMSNGVATGKTQVYQVNQFGRIISQVDGSFADIQCARLALNSTTEGFLTPRMTTAQKNAIVSPQEGLEVYDLTLHKKCVYTGAAWETITSV